MCDAPFLSAWASIFHPENCSGPFHVDEIDFPEVVHNPSTALTT
jgi:hypothetical protein